MEGLGPTTPSRTWRLRIGGPSDGYLGAESPNCADVGGALVHVILNTRKTVLVGSSGDVPMDY